MAKRSAEGCSAVGQAKRSEGQQRCPFRLVANSNLSFWSLWCSVSGFLAAVPGWTIVVTRVRAQRWATIRPTDTVLSSRAECECRHECNCPHATSCCRGSCSSCCTAATSCLSLSLSVVCALALSFQSADSKFYRVATLPVGALPLFLGIYFD